MQNPEYDAMVVGSGPNGLAAAITLQQQGVKVLLVEESPPSAASFCSAELTLPGFLRHMFRYPSPRRRFPFFKPCRWPVTD